ncbi:MAG: cytochrome c biogenesis protein CcsA [Planctomycetota bacterium]|nr:cytochrome c biogenesis protein CcsA [Planctomycetota bacterium]MDA1105554.1 cytochrome c biogenesis protein CcsA [Planctomycetota bacterium]
MAGRGPLVAVASLFSNVRFGISLLAVLFVYMSLGSAGLVYPEGGRFWESSAWVHAQMRQWPAFDMTEFEWFHWWPFDLLLALIAANITVTTIRRIPFKPINFGVWMIHSGILTLIAGSVIYFSQKVEGDAPVAMREIVATVTTEGSAGTESIRLVASPGMRATLGRGDDAWTFTVASIDPEWELRSGGDAGSRAYSVTVLVEAEGRRFMRQLVAGHPEYTEDLIVTGDPQQPVKRAIKETGSATVEPRLTLGLEYASQGYFYLRNDLSKSWAVYVRKPGGDWHERRVDGVPLYSDAVLDPNSVFVVGQDGATVSNGLSVAVPPQGNDPFPGVTLEIDSYLRYAQDRVRFVEGPPEAPLDPMLWLSIESNQGPEPSTFRLAAFHHDERLSEGGFIRFDWIESESELAEFLRPAALEIDIPGLAETIIVPARPSATTDAAGLTSPPDAAGFRPIGEGAPGLAYRVVVAQSDLKLEGRVVAVAIVEFRTSTETIRRWVFDDLSLCRDVALDGQTFDDPRPPSEAFTARFTPGAGDALVTFVAGPDPATLRVVSGGGAGGPSGQGSTALVAQPISAGGVFRLPAGINIGVERYVPRVATQTIPAIIPSEQRIRDARELFAQVRMSARESSTASAPVWVKYSPYPFKNELEVLRRHPFSPVTMSLADGSTMEVLFSRQRLPLRTQVALEEFVLTSHIGGFTGENSSIRDYTSMLRFKNAGGDWTAPESVSVNAPIEHDGLWYFQAQWDPPEAPRFEGDVGSLGRNYTVLGVGNREGVWIQLFGCCVAVLGMCYAFYVKPILRRNQSERAKTAAEVIHAQKAGTTPAGATIAARGASAVAMLALAVVFGIGGHAWADGDVSLPQRTPTAPFVEQVDLTPLGAVAVHTDGRLKSFGSFAHQMMAFVSGPRRIAGQSPEFTYLDLMIRSSAYDDADIIFVKGKPNRGQIAEALLDEDPSLAKRMDTFLSSGLISPTLLKRPAAARVLQHMSGDVIRTAKVVDQIEQALAVRDPQFLLRRLRVVPPGGVDPAAPWHGISDVMLLAIDPEQARAAGADPTPIPDLSPDAQRRIAVAWRSLIEAWTAADPAATNAAVAALASSLQECNPAVYPDSKKLAWESWYFQQGNLVWIWLIYLASIVFLLLGAVYQWPKARWAGLAIFFLAFALHTAAVMLRWWVSGRWPNSNMFEAVTTSAWMGGVLALVVALLLERFPRKRTAAGLVVLCSATASMVALMAAHFMPMELNASIGNMMPVLHDVWLYIHTNVIIFSYALIFMAAITALLYIAYRLLGGPASYARAGGSATVLLAGGMHREDGRGRFGEVLDGVTMLLMELSFVMLWSGIVMGAIWADHSWGRPWGWDPKEVFALNTFVVFAILVHVRLKVRDKGYWTAILAVIGALVMLFNWIVINFVITGLHSYA